MAVELGRVGVWTWAFEHTAFARELVGPDALLRELATALNLPALNLSEVSVSANG